MSSGDRGAAEEDLFDTIGFALKVAQQALRTYMDAELQRIGLTTPQYSLLAILRVEPGASNAALARRAFVTPQTMQAILVGLEREGLVTRTPHPVHGRLQTTELTSRGQTALAEATGIVAEAEARLRAASAPLAPDAVTAMLRRLAEALRQGPDSLIVKART